MRNVDVLGTEFSGQSLRVQVDRSVRATILAMGQRGTGFTWASERRANLSGESASGPNVGRQFALRHDIPGRYLCLLEKLAPPRTAVKKERLEIVNNLNRKEVKNDGLQAVAPVKIRVPSLASFRKSWAKANAPSLFPRKLSIEHIEDI